MSGCCDPIPKGMSMPPMNNNYAINTTFNPKDNYSNTSITTVPFSSQPMSTRDSDFKVKYGPDKMKGPGYNERLAPIGYLSSPQVDSSFYHAGSSGIRK